MPQWSHSRLETYRQCPRKFHFRYVAKVKLPEEPETLAAFAGSRAHDALEWLYRTVRQGGSPAREAMLETFRRGWAAEWHEGVMMPDERPAEAHRAEVEGWLGDYFDRHAPFAEDRTIDLERRISFPLDAAGRHTMIGFIDRLSRAGDGAWRIHDYKTNRRLPTQQDKDADPQLAYYEIGIRRLWPDDVREVELVWHFLAFGVSITSRRAAPQLDALKDAALSTIAEVESRGRDEAAFPTRESRLCDWCEYQSVCPARRHLVKVAALPPSKYAKEPGVRLVNAWAALDARRRELKQEIAAVEAEIDDVRGHLETWAAEHGFEVVAGDEQEAVIKRSEVVVFPRRSYDEEAEEAAALDAQLRASTHWPEVSEVDRSALARLWARRAQLGADLRALLEEFARVEEKVDVRLRKRRPR